MVRRFAFLLAAALPFAASAAAAPRIAPAPLAIRPLATAADLVRPVEESKSCLGCHVRHRLLTPTTRISSEPLVLRGQPGGFPYAGSGMAIVASHPTGVALPTAPGFFSPPLDADGSPQLPLATLSATSGTASSLVDATQTFADLTGATIFFLDGPNAGATRAVASNSATELFFAALPFPVTVGTSYRLDRSGALDDNLLLEEYGVASTTRGALTCLSCHRDHRSAAAAGSPVRREAGSLCGSCHETAIHSSAALGGRYGVWGEAFTCQTCHQPHDATNASLVRSSIAGLDGVQRPVRLIGARGAGSFADGDATYDGVCEVCHTRTSHFRRDGAASDQLHGNVDLETGADCRSCHPHRLGFKASCDGCHMPTPATQSYAVGAGAHERHVVGLGYACTVCHSQADHNEGQGTVLRSNVDVRFSTYAFGGGTTMENGGVPTGRDRNGIPTCFVGCHNPIVASPVTEAPNLSLSIGWTEPGPLACTRCHDTHGAELAAAKTRHPVDRSTAAAERADCQRCHDSGEHTRGTVQLKTADGQVVALDGTPGRTTTVCYSCHDPDAGPPLGGKVGATVEGYYSGLDFHGSRAGTGWGGTLKPPYARGQGPLTCSACHDSHTAQNPFLLAGVVNGQAVSGIDRAGNGAEALCSACHAGEFHSGCGMCHTAATGSRSVAATYASRACFACHNHFGIVNYQDARAGHSDEDGAPHCVHCHGRMNVYTTADAVPPTISSLGANVSATGADVFWGTNEPATTGLDYGLGAAAMSPTRRNDYLLAWHTVRLTGLQPNTTYFFLARSADGFGNEATAPGTFTTRYPEAPSVPVLTDEGDAVFAPGTSGPVQLQWSASTSPSGNPIEYVVEVSAAADFASLVNSSGWIATTSHTVTLGKGPYWFRVQARDALQPDRLSNFSAADAFDVLEAARPSVPVLVDQPNYYTSPTNVVLQWGASVQPAGHAVQYEAQLASRADFVTLLNSTGWIAGQTWPLSVSRGPYYWRVRARDALFPEAVSAWSPTDSFGWEYWE